MSWFKEEAPQVHADLQPQPGLQAMSGPDRARVDVADPWALRGSVDLDHDLRASFPQDARWDYGVGFGETMWFIEVHSASSSGNIEQVVRKACWLHARIAGTPWALRARHLVWIASGRVCRDPSFSRRRRMLQRVGVRGPVGRLVLGPDV